MSCAVRRAVHAAAVRFHLRAERLQVVAVVRDQVDPLAVGVEGVHALAHQFRDRRVVRGRGDQPQRHLVAVHAVDAVAQELGIEADPPTEITRYEFAYPGKNPILLIFLSVPGWSGEIENRIFKDVRWVSLTDLPRFDFLEADAELVDEIADRKSVV